MHAVDFHKVDFAAEVAELFRHSDFNFGKGACPLSIVKEAVLKSTCGWHNGSTAQSIIVHLGYVIPRHNKADKLTPKGKAFLWWAFKDVPAAHGNTVHRVITETPPASDVQVNPGWGILCTECKHVEPDTIKHVVFSPSTPCRKRKFTPVPRESGHGIDMVPVFDLVRHVDGTESCPRFERAQ